MRAQVWRFIALSIAAASAACTVHKTEQPALSGPSGLAIQLQVTAKPDRLSQDGASISGIEVRAIGPHGESLAGQRLRLDMYVNGQLADYGTLSTRTPTTGSDGVARVTYTAPPAPAPPANQTQSTVSIRATPDGVDAQASNQFQVQIDLMPVGVILPPAGAPTASFTYTPSSVGMLVPTSFDASASLPGTNASSITSYAWSWGDGTGGSSGRTVSHTFQLAGTFTVTLTVTNDRGFSSSTSQSIGVANDTGAFNAGDWITSPPFGSAFVINQAILFNADAIRTVDGRQVTVFNWNFGDSDATQPTTGFLVSHTFATAGTYNIVLSVADELGRKKVFQPKAYVIGAGNPVASFVAAVLDAATHAMTFDASGSSAAVGSTIVSYAWAFGDGTFQAASSSPTASRTYATAGAKQVRLTVTDDKGRTAVFTQTVTVP